jgi:hypothetical protein
MLFSAPAESDTGLLGDQAFSFASRRTCYPGLFLLAREPTLMSTRVAPVPRSGYSQATRHHTERRHRHTCCSRKQSVGEMDMGWGTVVFRNTPMCRALTLSRWYCCSRQHQDPCRRICLTMAERATTAAVRACPSRRCLSPKHHCQGETSF